MPHIVLHISAPGAPDLVRAVALDELPVTLGRSRQSADVPIDHMGVSRRHCVLERGEGARVIARDLGSTSGTYLDGAQVSAAEVHHGDVLRLGAASVRIELVVESGDPGEAPTTRTAPTDHACEACAQPLPADPIPGSHWLADDRVICPACAAQLGSAPAVGAFRLLGPIERTRAAATYKALDQAQNRLVCLELIELRGALDAADAARIAELAAARSRAPHHPNLVRLLGARASGSQLVVATDFTAGPSLAASLEREGPLPLPAAARLARALAAGLDHVHRQGLVHGAVAPSAVLLQPDGPARLTRVHHRALEELVPLDLRMELGGAHRAEPDRHAAPESFAGDGTIGPAADVYSLAAVLYEAVTGRPPHASAKTVPAFFEAIRRGPPDPAHAIRKELPEPAWRALCAALHPDPARRPRAEELGRAFARAITEGRAAAAARAAADEPERPKRCGGCDRQLAETDLAAARRLDDGNVLCARCEAGIASRPPFGPVHLLRSIAQKGDVAIHTALHVPTDRLVTARVLTCGPEAANELRHHAEQLDRLRELEHANIIGLRDALWTDGNLFVLTEHVDGIDLDRRLKERGPLRLAELARLARGLGDALDHAHARGVLHLGLAPQQVIIDREGEARLGGFGLEPLYRALPRARSDPSTIDERPPVYMAPESFDVAPKAFADACTLTARADIYSLAAVLHAAATGVAPHHGAKTIRKLLEMMFAGPPPRPTDLRPDLPDAAWEALAAAFHPEPQRRPERASDLARAFARAIEMDQALKKTVASAPAVTVPTRCEQCERKITPEVYERGRQLSDGRLICARCESDAARRTVFGPFHLLRLVGRGEGTEVHVALHGPQDRIFAVKLLPIGEKLEPATLQLIRELGVHRDLRHPGIVALHEVAPHEERLCFVLDHVEGRSLREQVERDGMLPLPYAARLAKDLGAALDYAHGRDKPHGAIKPSNVLIGTDARARLTDFGTSELYRLAIGRSQPGIGGAASTLFRSCFVPPERFDGAVREGVPGDVYSLAATLYHAVTGRPPHHEAVTLRQLIASVDGHELTPATELRPDVPAAAASALARALARDPAARPRSAGELTSAFAAAIEQEARRP